MKGYKVEGELWKGVNSEVFKVRRKKTNKIYAMKVVKIPKVNLNKFMVEKELQKQANKLINIHAIKCLKFAIHEFDYIKIMEYCPNGSLADLIAKYKKEKEVIPKKKTIKIITQTLIGVEFFHDNDLTHKNLKPSNILIDSAGDIKITDTVLSDNLYKKSYSSAEALEGGKYSKADDVWSLGCIFYELCCFQQPYEGLTIRVKGWRLLMLYIIDMIKTCKTLFILCLLKKTEAKLREPAVQCHNL
eukprot:TRINITY_DN2923_c0_g4_i1.p1 TRINITY_DN2923_c0_g4~~TRINITY_DN2923_c0_g4_i1.p1  ORF type:complete len:245 (+),score=39.26 TRINITY_DN2923_c0_g4_i1:64-798(+)